MLAGDRQTSGPRGIGETGVHPEKPGANFDPAAKCDRDRPGRLAAQIDVQPVPVQTRKNLAAVDPLEMGVGFEVGP